MREAFAMALREFGIVTIYKFLQFSIDYIAHVVKKSNKKTFSFISRQFSRPASHHARLSSL